jgi:hypothetical protein
MSNDAAKHSSGTEDDPSRKAQIEMLNVYYGIHSLPTTAIAEWKVYATASLSVTEAKQCARQCYGSTGESIECHDRAVYW